MPGRSDTHRYPHAPAYGAPRAEHEAYAKNPRAHGYTHWFGTDGKRNDLPKDFGFFWLPCPRCGTMFGGHEGHYAPLGDRVCCCPDPLTGQ